MKKTAFLLVAALLVFTAVASADEPIVEKRIHLKIVTDAGEVVDLENLGDMEPGDVQQIYTDDGTPVLVERNEAGFVITVEGEEPVTVDLSHHGAIAIDVDCDGEDCEKHVEIKNFIHEHAGAGAQALFIGEDGTEVKLHGSHHNVWVESDDDGNTKKIVRIQGAGGGGDAIARLLASGVLDDLEPEKRHEILQALAGGDGKVVIKKRHAHDHDE